MPQIERPIKDSGLTIIRPVAKAVIRQVCEAVGIDPRVDILFPDSKGVVEQPGSTVESKDNTPKFNSDDYISIVVEDKPGFEGGVYYETRHKSETPPVFSDPALGLFLAPIVSNRELFINITYRSQDGVQAKAWVENMRSRVIATRLRIPHRVSAYYIVPDEIIEIIEHVYELRENKAGYGESLQDYFVARADNRFTTFTDQGEKNKALGFSVPYAELYGWFENPNEPDKPERGDKGESYTATLTYRVQLDVHTSMLLRYPIIVHNQYVDRKFLYEIKPTFYDKLNVDGTQAAILDGYYGAKRPALDPEFSYGIRLPKHDDWLAQPLTYAPHTLQLYLVLIVVDEKNPKLFMNIQDVQELKLPDFVWDYIRSETNWMLTAANSLFQFSLFLQDEPYPVSCVDISNTLDITVKNVVSLRYQQHARFGVYLDLKYLNEAARDRLKNHGRVLDWWIKTYRPDIKWTSSENGLGEDNDYVSDSDMSYITGLNGRRTMETVETFGLQVYRR